VKKNWFTHVLALALLVSVILTACTPTAATPMMALTNTPAAAAATEAPTATQAPTATSAPTATAAPTATSAPSATPTRQPSEMILATTTSTADSGLLDYLLPDFEKQYNVKVKVVAVGSGQAIQMGVEGNADVLLVHSPAAEKDFMDKKNGVRREDVMYNDFIIIGPEADPAKIGGIKTGVDAFKAIAAAQATFISRGDNSGTHTKELGLWKSAAIEPQGAWYVKAGQGMAAVLTMAVEKDAYTLSDRATYLTQTQKGLKLKILVEGDKGLLNPYGVIAVDPQKSPKIQAELANLFIDWLIALPTQQKIAEFKKAEFGKSIFFPSSTLWKEANP